MLDLWARILLRFNAAFALGAVTFFFLAALEVSFSWWLALPMVLAFFSPKPKTQQTAFGRLDRALLTMVALAVVAWASGVWLEEIHRVVLPYLLLLVLTVSTIRRTPQAAIPATVLLSVLGGVLLTALVVAAGPAIGGSASVVGGYLQESLQPVWAVLLRVLRFLLMGRRAVRADTATGEDLNSADGFAIPTDPPGWVERVLAGALSLLLFGVGLTLAAVVAYRFWQGLRRRLKRWLTLGRRLFGTRPPRWRDVVTTFLFCRDPGRRSWALVRLLSHARGGCRQLSTTTNELLQEIGARWPAAAPAAALVLAHHAHEQYGGRTLRAADRLALRRARHTLWRAALTIGNRPVTAGCGSCWRSRG